MEKAVKRRKLWLRCISYGLLIFIAFFVVAHDIKAAVTGKIAGVVRDAKTGEPLPGANILIEGTDRGAACDVDGYYYIIRLEPGNYNVQARMMGYRNLTKAGVRVTSGHTSPLNFELEDTVVADSGVTIIAEREVIKMDLAGSSFAADKSEIEAVPLISGVKQYINLQAGIAGWSVRGGSQGDTKLLADGLLLVDQRANEPIMMPNLSEIKEVRVEKGGFTAEYSNVRSGVINVITREGSPGKYEGSFEFRYTPGYQKHSGKSIFDPYNYNNAVYLWNKLDTGYVWNMVGGDTVGCDTVIKYDSVCWKGTRAVWGDENSPFYDTIKEENYPAFGGWESVIRRDTLITTAEMQRDRFLWMRRINIPRTDSLLLIYNGGDSIYAPIYGGAGDTTLVGYEKVAYDFSNQDRTGEYGNKPDWTLDAGFGGPIPVIGSYLGDMTFYTSYRDHNEMFAIPDSRDYYRERTTSLKLTSRFGNFKVNMKGAYSIINSLSPYGEGHMWQGENLGGEIGQVYLRGGSDMLFGIAEYDGIWHGSNKLNLDQLYRVNALTPFDVTSRMYGLTLQHALSENTFYDVHLTYIRSNNRAQFNYDVPTRMKGDTVVLWFLEDTIGITKYALDDLPFGWAHPLYEENYTTDVSGDVAYGFAHQCGTWNTSWSQTYSAGFDMNSQLNKYNLIKFGLSFQYDNLHEYYITNEGWFWHDDGVDPDPVEDHSVGYYVNYDASPILAGGYIQDKIEFEGMFANFGLRFDYSDANIEWPSLDEPYSPFLSRWLKDSLFTQGPVEDVAAAFKISPRLGISFPVLEKSKLFFNYGHFYSLPASVDKYKIDWGAGSDKVHFLGNPRLEMERTVSYEVGLESSIANTYMARISGYYKDIDNETEEVRYYGEEGEFVDYYTPESNGYGDTRGFEFEFRKAHGRFFTGWVNYDYMVKTSGKIGLTQNYEEPLRQSRETEVDPEEDKPIPQPVFRAQVTLKTPQDWGIFLGGYNLSFLYQWRAGYYDTFDAGKDEELWGDLLQNNIQWPDTRIIDMSINKNLSIGGVTANLFMDVHNIFNWGALNSQCFDPNITGDVDRIEYFKSLHLEIYDEEPFVGDDDVYGPEELGVEPDHVGDLRSEDKPYINNPNRDYLYYLDPRYVQFGIRFSF
jgi:hypothetical protein